MSKGPQRIYPRTIGFQLPRPIFDIYEEKRLALGISRSEFGRQLVTKALGLKAITAGEP